MTHPTTPTDAVRDTGADSAPIGWATTRTMPYAAASATPAAPAPTAPAVGPTAPATAPAPDTAPALNPPVWSGRKTAIAAALAIGISSVGAVGAAAAIPVGSTQGGSGQFQPGGLGGRGQGGFGPGGVGQQGQLGQPGQPGAAPSDPNAATR
ncbi:hypothetical protein [Phycicoccus sp. Soil748]|uniref:hypothetical protein n=1 Tax=Phycicoccus sp. Soil748 TaxID=1736397 RepID=UPI0007036E9E|nr:hypothetical protein [Phycicoccus sp. Soil748]KRE56259.1 hypothetical protein ASG70_03705 [Phycicoccus sp. Soil748]